MTLTLDSAADASAVSRAEVTISGEYVLNVEVVLVVGSWATGTPEHVWLYEYLDSDERYAIARDAARAALRQYKVKVKDLWPHSARLVTMDRATHAAARANELADLARANGRRVA